MMFKKSFLFCYLKRILVFFLSICFLELVFNLVIFKYFELENILNIFLFSLGFSSFLSILIGLLPKKGEIILNSVILFVFGFLYSVQLVFYNVFKTFFSFSILGLGDQLNSFLGETFNAIIGNIIYILLLMIPFILYLFFKKKLYSKQNNIYSIFLYLILLFVSLSSYAIHLYSTKGVDEGSYYLYKEVNNISLNIPKFGVLNSYIIDLKRSIFGFDETIKFEDEQTEVVEEVKEEEIVYEKNILDLNFNKKTSNKDIQSINKYIEQDTGTYKNEYTGLFEGYNLIYITAESFSQIAVSEELTPTLYRLTHSGFIFDNYYTPNTLSTIGGEFQSLLGLYPDSGILTKWRKGTNYFPFGLATTYKKLGYKTYAYHNNWYGFQDRHKYLKSQGFTNYLGCYNGLEKRMNCKAWPQSDLEMMKATMKDYVNSDTPFVAYYMTVSGHFSYSFSDNNMAKKNKKYVNNMKVSTAAKAYVATQIELDCALEYLIKTLEEKNKLDNTVIVLLADHYPYKLSMNDVNSLSSYKRDNVVEVNHNNLILWNSKVEDMHITKPCMSSDVLPTVYNLFGIDYDSRLFTGRDILSTSDGIAIMSNRSWVTSKGTYFASSRKFVPKEDVDADYVAKINQLVKNRLNISKLIIKNDYYKYLMK